MRSTSKTALKGRFNLRVSASQERLIRSVAAKRGMSVTDFILESACSRAEEALSEQTTFALAPAEWNKFVAALDRPARVKPRLARLFAERTITERGR
jgi:uncharacterized protein (DUF1778 family)